MGNGPMQGSYAHLASVGYPVPTHANATDHFMDLITPGRKTSCQDTFLQFYDEHCKLDVMKTVEEELDNTSGSKPLELLERRRSAFNQAKFGTVPPIRDSVHATSFWFQLRIVFKREITLTSRDKQGVVADLISAVAKAFVIGIAYYGIGSQTAYQQVAFYFMLCMTCSI